MDTHSKQIIQIAITGPESTGKSTLSNALAEHYNTAWVKEYARSYINELDRPYTYEDLVEITRGQIQSEENLAKNANRYLFCDTDLLVIKIWSEYKYGRVHPEILNEYKKPRYALHLLMDIDLPWTYDPQREHPDKRQFFFEWFEKELSESNARYDIIRGNDNERLKNAIDAIESYSFR